MARRRNQRQSHALSRLNPAVWISRHLQTALASLGRLSRSPISTFMTTAVIGIALALPAGLHLLVNNLQALSGTWDGAASISLFLRQEINLNEAEALAERLREETGIAEATLISREQALEEFKQLSGFTDALNTLDENPLPHVILLVPDEMNSEPEAAEALLRRVEETQGTDYAQLDLQWVKRFHGITEIAERGVLVLTTLLGLAILLIVGNTIRLEIQNRHDEIEIFKLIGATDAFIRRPFLYSGLWYGLFGGLIAWIMVIVSLWLVSGPVTQLAGLYNSDFSISGMNLMTVLVLMGGSAWLGLAGSWIAVAKHLHEIEPA